MFVRTLGLAFSDWNTLRRTQATLSAALGFQDCAAFALVQGVLPEEGTQTTWVLINFA